ncbi:cytochrome C biogenesis protein DipZ [Aliidongia dinghuensis]|uniref:Cytochrome C biogenesis protein DipZ n=1 Tax=Aliidongia dinghuensis TaxID=1867774 RepID=A0A8J2YTN6_9PROT|nr:cytochrome c biogenesis protein DipZ [Aliidongia dinghuensis]GGF18975.1 cytochrome C biogenesis protein DipZ [Aliidongia dinghuensis]
MALLVIAYLGGVLTILSPCILPVLPFVFARVGHGFARSTLPMLAGMALTFSAVATLAAVGGGWAVEANEYGRSVALGVLAAFGLALVSPRLAAVLTRPLVASGNGLLDRVGQPGGAPTDAAPTVGRSLLLGIATGLVWAPCAGPVLGLVLTGAALHGANARTSLLLLAYAAGAVTSLGLALLIGGRVLAVMKRAIGPGEWLRRGLGAAVLAGVAATAIGADTGLIARFSASGPAHLEQALIDRVAPDKPQPATDRGGRMILAAATARPTPHLDLPVEGELPPLDGAVAWLNSAPLSPGALRGKVVLVDFWTYSCINCIRTIPYVRAWAEKYKDQGLVVIGVHTPEFAFERKIDNIKQAIGDFRIDYPVAVDSDYKIWQAFENNYWPALYFIDAKGQIRYHQFGEGGSAKAEKVIQSLLAEAGAPVAGGLAAASEPVTPDAHGAEAAPDLRHIRSRETYLGFDKASNFASPQGARANAARDYTVSALGLNEWGLTGNWTVGAERATLNRPDGGIAFRFSARDLHLVLGPGATGKPVRFRVTIDGTAPGESHGADIDADGNGTVTETRLYQLVRQAGDVGERTFEIRFLDPGVDAFVFTFG